MKQYYKLFAKYLVGIILILGSFFFVLRFHASRRDLPPQGVVPNQSTAIKIAEAVWKPIYEDSLYAEFPIVAEYDGFTGIWTVRGTLPPNYVGGVPEIMIRAATGEVLYIMHGK